MATVVIAVSGYAVIVLAGHALSPADYERFTVYWGLFFACTGVLDGLLQETTRAVAARRRGAATAMGGTGAPGTAHPARPVTVAVGTGLAAGALALATAPLWADRLVPGAGQVGAGLFAVGLASYTVQAAVCGLLSASGRWRGYALLIGADSAVRVVLAVLAWAAGWTFTAFLLVTVVGAVTWTGVLCAGRNLVRDLVGAVADVGTVGFLRRCAAAMAASGANAVLVTGFPVLFTVTAPDAAPGSLAAVITAVTLARAPVLVPLQRFTPALIVFFSRRRGRVTAALWLPVCGCMAVAVCCGAVAWVAAVPVVSVFLPAELVAGAGAFAVLTCAAGSLAVLMVTGTATLTVDRHGAHVAGWAVATVVAVAVLTAGEDPVVRASLALGLAPWAGVVVHLVALASVPGPAAGSPGRDVRPS